MSADELKTRDALETVSDMIEEIWGGLVMAVEDTGSDPDVPRAMLRGLLRIANQARGEMDVALGNARRG